MKNAIKYTTTPVQFLLMVTVTLFHSAPALSNEWPMLVENQDNANCQAILSLAAIAYSPKGDPLNAHKSTQNGADREAILKIYQLEDLPDFESADVQSKSYAWQREIHWYKKAYNGLRLTFFDSGVYGPNYSIVIIPEEVSQEEVSKNRYDNYKKFNNLSTGALLPLVFRDTKAKSYLVVTFGHAYEYLHNWEVYSTDVSGKFTRQCVIQIHPQKTTSPVSLLPAAVQQFDRLVLRSIGDDDDGNYHPIARLKNNAKQNWATAAVRPWAAISHSYNSREQVDRNLQQWAKRSAYNQRVYDALVKQRPIAEQALVNYYSTKFQMTSDKSKETAHRVLEDVFLSYYLFPQHS